MAKRFYDPDVFEKDYVKAVRRRSREEEFEMYGRTNARPSMRPERIKESKKAYKRSRDGKISGFERFYKS